MLDPNDHNCIGVVDGDNIIYKCEDCSYRAVYNRITHKTIQYDVNATVVHCGFVAGDKNFNVDYQDYSKN